MWIVGCRNIRGGRLEPPWHEVVLHVRRVPLNVIFGTFASAALVSVVLVLLIRPRAEGGTRAG